MFIVRSLSVISIPSINKIVVRFFDSVGSADLIRIVHSWKLFISVRCINFVDSADSVNSVDFVNSMNFVNCIVLMKTIKAVFSVNSLKFIRANDVA